MSKQALKIKVCGMRDPLNLEEVCTLQPDYIGFIFYQNSKRFVGNQPDPALFRIPPAGMKKVGVFVNEEAEQVKKKTEQYGLDLVQLHGEESPAYCDELRRNGIPVIKALVPDKASDVLGGYAGKVDLFLFDSATKTYGGSGRKFDWDVLQRINIPGPYMLSGGLGPGDSGSLLALDHQEMSAIDLNSRFEVEPGMKDMTLLGPFINEIRK